MSPPAVGIDPLPPGLFALAAQAINTPDINRWMYHEWREHVITERTIAAAAASKRNRLYLAVVDTSPYGLLALGSISEVDRTASVWYLRFPDTLRRAGAMARALDLVVDRAFSELMLNSLTASVHQDNIASMLLLERVGFNRAGMLRQGFVRDGQFVDRVFYDLLRADRLA